MRIEGNYLIVWNSKAKEVAISFDEICLEGVPHNEKEVHLFNVTNDSWVFVYMLTRARANELKLHYWGQTRRYNGCETYVLITSSPQEYATDNQSEIVRISKEKIFNIWETIRDYKRATTKY